MPNQSDAGYGSVFDVAVRLGMETDFLENMRFQDAKVSC
jgi:hypothetical protein